MFTQTPAYNLKVVLKETGLKADVLRAWERRYHLPVPSRTPGGHRLYSAYDIALLKWLKARQDEGLSISRAVELWRETIAAGRDPLLTDSPTLGTAPDKRFEIGRATIDLLREKWLEANLAFDSQKADQILNQAFSVYPVEKVCTEIIQHGINEIGENWFIDRASVQQEHFASALAIRRLEALITGTPPPTRHVIVVMGCPAGELHTFPVLLLSFFLRRKGYKVIYLGASVPVDKLTDTCKTIQPDLFVLAAQQLSTAVSLQSAALVLQQQGIPMAYGGLIFNRFPALCECIPAEFLGETLDSSVLHIERLLAATPAIKPPIEINESALALAKVYRQKRTRIELVLGAELQNMELPEEYLDEANLFFGNGLFAALSLGNPAFIEADLDWVQRLLAGRLNGGERLIRYLAAYRLSIQKEMGSGGAPITDWIDSYLVKHSTLPITKSSPQN